MKKLVTIIALALALVLSLTACAQWRTDVSVKDLTGAVKQAAPYASGWIPADSDYISASAWGEDHADYMAKVEEYTILLSGDLASNVNEIGIFRLGAHPMPRRSRALSRTILRRTFSATPPFWRATIPPS